MWAGKPGSNAAQTGNVFRTLWYFMLTKKGPSGMLNINNVY